MNLDPIGATPDEVASAPALLFDLALSLVPRRVALAHGLLAILGGAAAEKVASCLDDVRRVSASASRSDAQPSLVDRCVTARALLESVDRLEQAVFSLVLARTKSGLKVVPISTQSEGEQ